MNIKIDNLPLSYFDRNSHGDIISRFTNDVDTLVQSFKPIFIHYGIKLCTNYWLFSYDA